MSWRVLVMILMIVTLWGVLSLQRVDNSRVLSMSEVVPYTMIQVDTPSTDDNSTPLRPAQPLNWENVLIYLVQLFAVMILVLPILYHTLNDDAGMEDPTPRIKNPLLNPPSLTSDTKPSR